MIETIKIIYNEFKKIVNEDDANSLAYHLILSLIPTISVVFLVIGLLKFQESSIFSLLELYFTDEILKIFNDLLTASLRRSRLGAAFIFTILSSLWASSRGMYTVRKVANSFYGVETKHKNIVLEHLISLGYMVLLIFVMVCALFLFGVIPFLQLLAGTKQSYQLLRILLLFSIAFIVSIVLNCFIPSITLKVKEVFIGSFVSTLLFVIFILLFIFILQNWDYKNVYGPLSLMVIGLMGFNFISIIIYIGFCINAVIFERRRISKLNVRYDIEKQRYVIIE